MDKLKKVAKTDIIVTIDWEIEENGPFKQVNYISLGLDAYTNKQIADATKVGQPNAAASVSLLLETAILANMDNFLAGLQGHFDDLRQNGREITLELRKFESFDGDYYISEKAVLTSPYFKATFELSGNREFYDQYSYLSWWVILIIAGIVAAWVTYLAS